MPAIYLRDVSIPEQWTGKESLDWLHPCHGPLPNKVGIVGFDCYEYCVALWCNTESITTMIELVECSNVRDNWDRMTNKKGWILNSLIWRWDVDGFSCSRPYAAVRIEQLKEAENEDLWLAECFRRIMVTSVEITARMTIGCPVFKASDLIQRKSDAI